MVRRGKRKHANTVSGSVYAPHTGQDDPAHYGLVEASSLAELASAIALHARSESPPTLGPPLAGLEALGSEILRQAGAPPVPLVHVHVHADGAGRRPGIGCLAWWRYALHKSESESATVPPKVSDQLGGVKWE